MCEVTGSSRSYVLTDGAQKELIKPFYTFTDCVCSLLCDIGPGGHLPEILLNVGSDLAFITP